MLFEFIKAKFGENRANLGYLHFLELLYDCRFAVEDLNQLEQSFEFFEENSAYLDFIQDGNLTQFRKLKKNKIFFGFISDSVPEAYEKVIGTSGEKLYSYKDRLYHVPLWVYVPAEA